MLVLSNKDSCNPFKPKLLEFSRTKCCFSNKIREICYNKNLEAFLGTKNVKFSNKLCHNFFEIKFLNFKSPNPGEGSHSFLPSF